MKQIEQVIDPLREQLKAQNPAGSIRAIFLDTPKLDRLYLMKVPVPGYGIDDIRLKKTLGAFAIFIQNEWESIRFEYDEEFLSIDDWTVLNGVLMVVLKYTVPAKYLEVNEVESIPADSFLTKYNQKRG